MHLSKRLQHAFPDIHFESEVPLAPYTTVKIGGPAEVLATVSSSAELAQLCQFCIQEKIRHTILGWGANTLIADKGIRGLVIRNQARDLQADEAERSEPTAGVDPKADVQEISPRYHTENNEGSFTALDYVEASNTPRVSVTAGSGWPLPVLMTTLLTQQLTGLQWFSRIPATLGGAIYNNIHGGTHFISEVIQAVTVLSPSGEVKTFSADECSFDYDYSRFHTSGEVILSARLLLWRGDTAKAREVISEWARRKQHQPQNSLGCVFQNISEADRLRLNLESSGTGYIIDKVLGLKGLSIGDAEISEKHAAFIVNRGEATAKDYRAVMRKIQEQAIEKLGLHLKPEIFFLGFDQE